MKVEKEYIERARKEGLATFSIMIDRRKIPVSKGGGYKHESAGCIDLESAAKIMEILRNSDRLAAGVKGETPFGKKA